MEPSPTYTLPPSMETAFKALAQKSAAELGYTLTPEQEQALAVELAQELPGSLAAVGKLVAEFCGQLVYDMENEHPVHTWGRWAADVENDMTQPGMTYGEWVEAHRHTGTVTVSGVLYTADAGVHSGLSSYFDKHGHMLPGRRVLERFDSFVQHCIAEGRLLPVSSAA